MNEPIQKPEIMVALPERTDPEIVSVVSRIDQYIHDDPDAALQTLNVAGLIIRNKTLEFWEEVKTHLKDSTVSSDEFSMGLDLWIEFINTNAHDYVQFDDETETELADSSKLKRLVHEVNEKKRETARAELRELRITTYVGRVAAYAELSSVEDPLFLAKPENNLGIVTDSAA